MHMPVGFCNQNEPFGPETRHPKTRLRPIQHKILPVLTRVGEIGREKRNLESNGQTVDNAGSYTLLMDSSEVEQKSQHRLNPQSERSMRTHLR